MKYVHAHAITKSLMALNTNQSINQTLEQFEHLIPPKVPPGRVLCLPPVPGYYFDIVDA